jgi:hypothetical protein
MKYVSIGLVLLPALTRHIGGSFSSLDIAVLTGLAFTTVVMSRNTVSPERNWPSPTGWLIVLLAFLASLGALKPTAQAHSCGAGCSSGGCGSSCGTQGGCGSGCGRGSSSAANAAAKTSTESAGTAPADRRLAPIAKLPNASLKTAPAGLRPKVSGIPPLIARPQTLKVQPVSPPPVSPAKP